MTMWSRILLAVAALQLFFAVRVSALDGYVPISRVCAEAEQIVVARCEAAPSQPGDESKKRIHLHVKRTIKGDPNLKQINVWSMNYSSCPMPPQYAPGTTVITFLNRAANDYYTPGSIHGIIDIQPEQEEVFGKIIAELVALQAKDRGYRSSRAYVEWVVDGIESIQMMCDALSDATSGEGESQQTYRERIKQFASRLDVSQKNRVLAVLLNWQGRQTLPTELVPLVADLHDRRLMSALAVELKDVADSPNVWMSDDVMEEMVLLEPTPSRSRMLEAFRKLARSEDDQDAVRRTIVHEFLKTFGPASSSSR